MMNSTDDFSQVAPAPVISSDLPMPDQVVDEPDGSVRPVSQRCSPVAVGGLVSVTLFDGEWSGDPISGVEFVQEESARPERAHGALRLLDSWLGDDSEYDEETWPELKEQLDEDRPSSRPLFP